MPIWKVSLTDGTFQVADADGAFYPLTTGGKPLTRFNEGWSPRGLQTGLPPFHVLELQHDGGDSTIWLHDEALDYRANAVLGLSPADQLRFFETMDAVIRTLYADCVLAPQAAIPSAAHQFDGMLPRTVALLTAESIRRVMPGTELVVLDQLQELHAGYGSGADVLSSEWIARAIDAPSAAAQERFDLPGLHCDRHLDPATGLVFYVMRSADASETSLFVPQRKVVLVRSRHTHDPLALLLNYYASHTDRAVVLPEALDLSPDMVVPPQHGLDEPPSIEEPVAAPSETGAVRDPAYETGYAAAPLQVPDQVPGREPEEEPGQARTVFEAPLSETPAERHADLHDDVAELEPTPTRALAQPEPAASAWHDGVDGEHEPPAIVPPDATVAPKVAAPKIAAPPPQNWWQRLLGLGNP